MCLKYRLHPCHTWQLCCFSCCGNCWTVTGDWWSNELFSLPLCVPGYTSSMNTRLPQTIDGFETRRHQIVAPKWCPWSKVSIHTSYVCDPSQLMKPRPQPTRRTSWKLVGNPACQPGLATSFQLVRLVGCGLMTICSMQTDLLKEIRLNKGKTIQESTELASFQNQVQHTRAHKRPGRSSIVDMFLNTVIWICQLFLFSSNLSWSDGKEEGEEEIDDDAWQWNQVVVVLRVDGDVDDNEDDHKHVQKS